MILNRAPKATHARNSRGVDVVVAVASHRRQRDRRRVGCQRAARTQVWLLSLAFVSRRAMQEIPEALESLTIYAPDFKGLSLPLKILIVLVSYRCRNKLTQV